MKTKWMYAFFPQETIFYGILKDGKRVKMLIRKDALYKLQEVNINDRKRVRGKTADFGGQAKS